MLHPGGVVLWKHRGDVLVCLMLQSLLMITGFSLQDFTYNTSGMAGVKHSLPTHQH